MDDSSERVFWRRRLPHWQPPERDVFLTWRLYGSLALGRIGRSGVDFVRHDRQMDTASSGPLWLHRPEIAAIVRDCLFFAESGAGMAQLRAWVIMPNHVHVLLSPLAPLDAITRAIKTHSARKANQALGRTGRPFWQHESYDHWVRTAKEFDRVVGYIVYNPVKAGLAATPEAWPWSSATRLPPG